MKRRIGFTCVLLILCAAARLTAQEPAQTPADDKALIEARIRAQDASQKASEPTLKENPLETLRKFEPAPDAEYQLGRGDEITVNFAGRPEMQAKLIVGPDGRITLPLAGDLMLADLTRAQAAKAIESALANYYTSLSIQVTVTKYTANRVLLLGAVDHPGSFAFDGSPTLLEVLARGGVEAGPNKSGSTADVNQIPERCAIYRGSDQVVWVELRAMMESGNALADLRLRRAQHVGAFYLCSRRGSASGRHSAGLQLDPVQHSGSSWRDYRTCGRQSAHPDRGSGQRQLARVHAQRDA
jgi:polysaccharide export outer membrane protein